MFRKLDGARDHIEQDKPDSENQTLNIFSHMWYLELKKKNQTKHK
jgi:hypothetical protein